MANFKIHSSAVVDPEAIIGSGVEVGPFCRVGPHVKIGNNSKLLSHVVIDNHTDVGANNIFHPFSVIGGVPQDLKYQGEDTRLIMGNSNVVRESVTINLGTLQGGGKTSVGDNCLLMAYVHLGHDCIVGSNVILSNSVGLAGHVVVEDFVTLTGMVGVQQFVHIGGYAYVGGQSGVERDVPPFVLALGTRPCSIKGANIVGLRRRGFPAEKIQKINEAIKLWTRHDVEKEQCLLDIESQYGESDEIRRLIGFIRKSKGVLR